jgi:hypothetical protein
MGDKDEGNFKTTSKDVPLSIVLWFENKYSVEIQSLCLIKKIVFFRFGALIEIVVIATVQGHVELIMFVYFAFTLSATLKKYLVVYWRCCILSQNSKIMHFNLRNFFFVFPKGIIK